jgi:hypothetical protein
MTASCLSVLHFSFYSSTVQQNFLWLWKCFVATLSNTVAMSQLWLLSAWNVASLSEELNFKFKFKFNSFKFKSPHVTGGYNIKQFFVLFTWSKQTQGLMHARQVLFP